MAKPPRRPPPQKRKSDLPAGDAVASRAVVPKKRDPRQAGIFDRPLPAFIRPQLAKLVTEAPEGERWTHELKFDGYRMNARIDRGRASSSRRARVSIGRASIRRRLRR
jgi:bifunctional non-homologous end joining protein LigD